MQQEESSPFLFGKLPDVEDFVNREKELKRLSMNCHSGINTILISPRRWGKSFLMKKLASLHAGKKSIRFCFVDLFRVRTEDEFYKAFSEGVIKGSSGKTTEWLNTAVRWLKGVSPKLSIPAGENKSIDLELDFQNSEKERSAILQLPEKIAKEKKIRIVVCIDEFQNIEQFDDPVGFQKILRSFWQHQPDVAYCLYGSKRSMMSQLFQSQKMPFYKFGDVMYLEKIEALPLMDFIINQFKKTKKKISREFAEQIVNLMQRHSFYVQQLAHFVWMHTEKEVNENIFDTAVQELLDVNRNLFTRDFENLSSTQINALRAITHGHLQKIGGGEIIGKYKLGSSANVVRIMDALEKKDIIDRFTGKVEFVDPVFEMWLKEVF